MKACVRTFCGLPTALPLYLDYGIPPIFVFRLVRQCLTNRFVGESDE